MNRRMLLQRAAASLLAASAPTSARGASDGAPRVLVAASLVAAVRAVLREWGGGGAEPPLDFGSSAALARRIELGAPADLFVSANTLWMDHLEQKGVLAAGSRRALLSNRLALAAAPGAATSLASRPEIDGGVDLRGALGRSGRLAIARVASAPLGIYGRQALSALGLWSSVSDRLAEAADARGALAFVAKGAAPLGVLYASDLVLAKKALSGPSPRQVGLFPATSHDPILYPAALTRAGAENASARDLLAFLASPEAMGVFKAYGFGAPAT